MTMNFPQDEALQREIAMMASGKLYPACNNQLLLDRLLATNELLREYNDLRPSQEAQRQELLWRLLGRRGERCKIIQPLFCDYGFHIEVGEDFFANTNLCILDEAPVTFGDHVFIGPNCSFYTACHPLDVAQRNEGLEYSLPIKVGNNVWFGGNVTVVPGVTIGDDCVIGAGSVVTRDIPAGVVAAGNPCRVLRSVPK